MNSAIWSLPPSHPRRMLGRNRGCGDGAGAERDSRSQVVVPVHGRYADLRGFLFTALERLPTLALDGMNLRRESVAGGEADAQLWLTLFVKGHYR